MSKVVKLRPSERYFLFISSLFFEYEPTEICSHLSEKGPSGRFFAPDKLKNHTYERKGNEKNERVRRKKGGKEKKAMVTLLAFILPTLEVVFGREKTV